MSRDELPPELRETDRTLRRAFEPLTAAAIGDDHVRKVRLALISETRVRRARANHDTWVVAGPVGALSVGLVGLYDPIMAFGAFALCVAWVHLIELLGASDNAGVGPS